MFDPVTTKHPDPSDVLTRLLRGGHGAGARHALTASDVKGAQAALDDCVTRDPRTVPSAESRSLYYARLYADLGLNLDGIAAHLFEDDDYDDPDRGGLPLTVLGQLARRGRRDAVDLLRRYAAEGCDWPEAVDQLAACPDEQALLGLCNTVLERGDDEELYDCVQRGTGMKPWRLWARANEKIADVVQQVDLDMWRWEMTRSKPVDPGCATPTVDQVLEEAATSPRRSFVCGRRLSSVAGPEHRGAILAAAWAGPDGSRAAALRYLGEQGDPALLDLAEAATAAGCPAPVRHAAAQAVGDLRSPEAVARARGWMSGEGLLGDAAARILAFAGDHTDGPALIDALEQRRAFLPDCAPEQHNRLCDIVGGIGRLGLTEALTPVLAVYQDSPYAALRGCAVQALAGIQPDFAATTAVDGLWDCEAPTRLTAVRGVELTVPGVRERLEALAADGSEAEDVRAAARERLAHT